MKTDDIQTEKRTCANCGGVLTFGPEIVVIVCPLCGSRAIGSSESEWLT